MQPLPCVAPRACSPRAPLIALDFKQRLQEDPTPLQTIMAAYLKLANEAKERRKPDDPWPVIIIDEANALREWEDKKSLMALLAFFVYLTKELQLAHGEPTGLLNQSRVREASCVPCSDPRHQRHVSAAVAGEGRVRLEWLAV